MLPAPLPPYTHRTKERIRTVSLAHPAVAITTLLSSVCGDIVNRSRTGIDDVDPDGKKVKILLDFVGYPTDFSQAAELSMSTSIVP